MSIYDIMREFHSGWRWLVLVMAVAAVIDFGIGTSSKRNFKALDNRISLFYLIAIDIQLLIGFVLYFFLSPVVKNYFSEGNFDHDSESHFFAVEHPIFMLIAIICVHVGRVMIKNASNSRKKFNRGFMWFMFSLVLLLAGLPW